MYIRDRLLFVLLISLGAKAQRAASMRTNEVLVINEDNFVNDYGKRHGWIELFNTSTGMVNIAGCYSIDNKNDPMKRPIPRGDVLIQIQPRQHALFWADEQSGRGTFHVNFASDPSKEDYIALYNADDKTLTDEITIPVGQMADINYGRVIDGKDEWAQLKRITPSTNNLTLDSNEKIDSFRQNDSLGIGMTITATAVMFLGLFLLYIIFKRIDRLSISVSKRNIQKAAGTTSISVDTGQESSEIFAAIAIVLYEMSDDNHDTEHAVPTIHKVQGIYSPWSSELYGLRQAPHK